MTLNNDCTVVITTFFSGKKLEDCLSRIPSLYPIIIIDNGCEKNNKSYYESKFKNLTYAIPGENLGIPRSYTLALSLVKTKFMFNTQPDVIIREKCIENLILAASIYPNAAILSPIIFHEGKYLLDGDYKILKLKKNRLDLNNYQPKKLYFNNPPDGDLCVDSVTATAMLIDTQKIKQINDWDNNIFSYYEDMDLCLRLRIKGFQILKIKNAEVDHEAFSSHDKKFENQLNFSRNWHYSWATFYFYMKHSTKFIAYKFGIFLLLSSFCKFIFYFFINKKKFNTHYAKFLGIFHSIFKQRSSYRPRIDK